MMDDSVAKAPSLTCVQTLSDHNRGTSKVLFSPNGEILASSSADSNIYLYKESDDIDIEMNFDKKKNDESIETNFGLKCKLKGHMKGICDIVWSNDSNYLCSCSDDNLIIIWDITKQKPIKILPSRQTIFRPKPLKSDFQFLQQKSIHSKKLHSSQSNNNYNDNNNNGNDNDYSVTTTNGKKRGKNENKRKRDKSISQKKENFEMKKEEIEFSCLEYNEHPNAHRFLYSIQKDIEPYFCSNVLNRLSDMNHKNSNESNIQNNIIIKNHNNIYSYNNSKNVKCFRQIHSFKNHNSYLFCLAWNNEQSLIASGSYDNNIRLWDARIGDCISCINGHRGAVTSLDFSFDGTMLLSSSFDGLIRSWDMQMKHGSFQCIKTIGYKEIRVSLSKFTPNCKYVLSSQFDSQITLWDFETSKPIKIYKDINSYNNDKNANDNNNSNNNNNNNDNSNSESSASNNKKEKETKGYKNARYCLFNDFLNNYIITGSEDARLYAFNIETKECYPITNHLNEDMQHRGVVISTNVRRNKNQMHNNDRQIVASGSLAPDPTLKIWVANNFV